MGACLLSIAERIVCCIGWEWRDGAIDRKSFIVPGVGQISKYKRHDFLRELALPMRISHRSADGRRSETTLQHPATGCDIPEGGARA